MFSPLWDFLRKSGLSRLISLWEGLGKRLYLERNDVWERALLR
jgi:hypothetical protein